MDDGYEYRCTYSDKDSEFTNDMNIAGCLQSTQDSSNHGKWAVTKLTGFRSQKGEAVQPIMNTSFDLIKKADQISKDIVTGFIKDAQTLLPNEKSTYYNIPELIFILTIIYYFNPEYFTIHGKYMRLNETKDTVERFMDPEAFWIRNTVYGNIVITKEDKGKFIWTFKTIEPPEETEIAIGIDSSGKAHANIHRLLDI